MRKDDTTLLGSVKQLWAWIKWKYHGSKIPACVVCGDDLETPGEVDQRHCARCWPTFLRTLEPPFVKEMRPLGKASSR